MKRPGVHVKVNFGQSPFMFDIDQMMQVSSVGKQGCRMLLIITERGSRRQI